MVVGCSSSSYLGFLAGDLDHSRSVTRPFRLFFFFCICPFSLVQFCILYNVLAYLVVPFPRGHVLLH